MYVPPGFAHGFFVTSATAEVEYKCSAIYNPSLEQALAWNDPTIGIEWPFSTSTYCPILSERDSGALTLKPTAASFFTIDATGRLPLACLRGLTVSALRTEVTPNPS